MSVVSRRWIFSTLTWWSRRLSWSFIYCFITIAISLTFRYLSDQCFSHTMAHSQCFVEFYSRITKIYLCHSFVASLKVLFHRFTIIYISRVKNSFPLANEVSYILCLYSSSLLFFTWAFQRGFASEVMPRYLAVFAWGTYLIFMFAGL